MPFAQWGYPHQEGSKEKFEASYPADFICEAIDQTRGWFYTLMTIGTLVFDKSSYENVLCLGHILDKDGRKMSKHLGNVLEPMALMDQHGADAVRWYMLAAGSPWSARRVSYSSKMCLCQRRHLLRNSSSRQRTHYCTSQTHNAHRQRGICIV
jgi:isoleucyl-tRNA synthetase